MHFKEARALALSATDWTTLVVDGDALFEDGHPPYIRHESHLGDGMRVVIMYFKGTRALARVQIIQDVAKVRWHQVRL